MARLTSERRQSRAVHAVSDSSRVYQSYSANATLDADGGPCGWVFSVVEGGTESVSLDDSELVTDSSPKLADLTDESGAL
jgi:hypothetical protein